MVRSWKVALPTPPPPIEITEPGFVTPHENDSTSISSLCLSSIDSPLMSPSFAKISDAMRHSYQSAYTVSRPNPPRATRRLSRMSRPKVPRLAMVFELERAVHARLFHIVLSRTRVRLVEVPSALANQQGCTFTRVDGEKIVET